MDSSPHRLRDRAHLRQPVRYGEEPTTRPIPVNREIRPLRETCRVKKDSIDRRLILIHQNILVGCSRTKLIMLRRQIQRACQELSQIHTHLLTLSPSETEYNIDWLEDVIMSVEEGASDVEEYLVEHLGDPPSSTYSEPGDEGSIDARSFTSDGNPVHPSEYIRRWQENSSEVGEVTRMLDSMTVTAHERCTDPRLQTIDYLIGESPILNLNDDISGAHMCSTGQIMREDQSNVRNPEFPTMGTMAREAPRRVLPTIPVHNEPSMQINRDQFHTETNPFILPDRGLNMLGENVPSIYTVSEVGSTRVPQTNHTEAPRQRNNPTARFRENIIPDWIAQTSRDEIIYDNPSPLMTRGWGASSDDASSIFSAITEPGVRGRGPEHHTLTQPGGRTNCANPSTQMQTTSPGFVYSGSCHPRFQQSQADAANVTSTNPFRPFVAGPETQVYEPTATNVPPQSRSNGNHGSPTEDVDSVDGWIDMLPNMPDVQNTGMIDGVPAYAVANRWLMNQNLPPPEIPKFNGEALKWVDFITHFREMVHEQPYLTTAQRATHLFQYLEGDAKRSVSGFGKEWSEYTRALKRLKFMFGDRARIAQAYLNKVKNGKPVKDCDVKGLTDLYYDISDCLSNLGRLNYNADLRSTDVLVQVLKRLPNRLINKWSSFSYKLRRNEEPSLIHLGDWLQDQVMASRDPYIIATSNCRTRAVNVVETQETSEETVFAVNTNTYKIVCPLCKGSHHLSKCNQFLPLDLGNKMKILRDRSLCFNCLKPGHGSSTCGSRTCSQTECDQKHHTLIHDYFHSSKKKSHEGAGENKVAENPAKSVKDDKPKPAGKSIVIPCKEEKAKDPKEEREEKTVGSISVKRKQVYCKVVKVKLKLKKEEKKGVEEKEVEEIEEDEVGQEDPGSDEVGEEETFTTFAFLDDGSDGTFIKEEFAREIGLQGTFKKVKINTITDRGKEAEAENVSFELSGMTSGAETFPVNNVTVLQNFKLKSHKLPVGLHHGKYHHLQGLGLEDVKEGDITLLIGADNYEMLVTYEIRRGKPNEPIGVRTALGWTIFGYDTSENVDAQVYSVNRLTLEESVESFWKTESFGTEFKSKKEISIQDQALLEKMSETSFHKDGRLVVQMLWKEIEVFPNTYGTAYKRYHSLRNYLLKRPKVLVGYTSVFSEYIKNGYTRKVAKNEIKRDKVWYHPHYPVIHPLKDIPRPVFDLAAKTDDKCLNDYLHTGPDLTNKLTDVLLRFREHPIALVADIEAMFYQVRVMEEDSHCLRFLWSDDLVNSPEPEIYEMLVHVFGARDSPSCSAFALRQTAIEHGEKFSSEVASSILTDFYVDDFLKSVESDEKAAEIARDVRELLHLNGFNLTKFVSNSKEALKHIEEKDHRTSTNACHFETDSNMERTLGVIWDIKEDLFTFSTSSIKNGASYTKRGVLKVLSSVFDPLGLLAPFVITAKIIMQNLWRRKCEWDEPLSQQETAKWSKWLEDLENVSAFKVERWVASQSDIRYRELHLFVDASEFSFGAVAYVRNIYHSNDPSSHILISRSRLAPIKTLSIPRLELQAAVLGVRLYKSIQEGTSLKFESVYFWTDSLIVLQYINNTTARFKVFVANRVSEIHEHTDIAQWRFVPGELNPADDMTRGLPIKRFADNSRWKNGPDFLRFNKSSWPRLMLPAPDDANLEIRATNVENDKERDLLERLKKYSTWEKLKRIVAWIMRFKANAQLKEDLRTKGFLKVFELRNSTDIIVKLAQMESFPKEFEALQRGEMVQRCSKMLTLRPFLDNKSTIRVGGRLKRANISNNSRHQQILESKSWLSKLYLIYLHRIILHEGPQTLIATSRLKMWIIGVKQVAKGVSKNCIDCKKKNSTPNVPVMADLPESRVTSGNPVFHDCGVDYFGPLHTKVKRSLQKRWGCLFTCMATRAVHLELVEGLESDFFINTLRRFMSRRGTPRRMISDCGTTFKGANRELKEALLELLSNNPKLTEFMTLRGIDWQFIPPHAPHMGGVWERLVQTVKRPLYMLLKDRVVSDFQMLTFFAEVEGIVNSRPLTPLSDSIDDYEALTPNHFLIGRANPNLPVTEDLDTDICSRKRWKQNQYLVNQFWRQWRREYLPLLTTRTKWHKEQRNIQVGDLVLIMDKDVARGKWKLARVSKTFPGDDGCVRVAQVETQSGAFIRPVSKLCLILDSA